MDQKQMDHIIRGVAKDSKDGQVAKIAFLMLGEAEHQGVRDCDLPRYSFVGATQVVYNDEAISTLSEDFSDYLQSLWRKKPITSSRKQVFYDFLQSLWKDYNEDDWVHLKVVGGSIELMSLSTANSICRNS